MAGDAFFLNDMQVGPLRLASAMPRGFERAGSEQRPRREAFDLELRSGRLSREHATSGPLEADSGASSAT